MEVMLAVAISAIVLAALGMAIDFQLRVLAAGRLEVEQAQLGRALLRRMADDIRTAVPYNPVDVESLLPAGGATAALSSAASALSGATGSQGSNASNSTNNQSTANLADAAAAAMNEAAGSANATGATGSGASTDIAGSTAPPSVPGLYGNQYEMQVDVSRLPRIDQYEQFLDPNSPAMPDRVSDVKTVAYYLGVGPDGLPAGLVRRQLDRAVSKYAQEQGGSEAAMHEELLAPEVTALEFRYYDGVDWVTEWDSDAQGTLPVAVEIALQFAPIAGTASTAVPVPVGEPALNSLSTLQSQPGYPIYRLLVHIPSGKPPGEGTTGMPTEGSNSSSTTGGSNAGSTSNSSAAGRTTQ
jgi:hypothetical protein